MATILVIEDEEGIRDNILDMLEAEDFEAFGAPDGRIGIQLAKEKKPDLIICDIMMPKLDGYGVLKHLRQDPNTATIPFIFLTAKSEKGDLRQGMALGADDYLTKPCQPEELLGAIATRLEKQAAINRQTEEKLEILRTNIAQSLPHELRTPLNSILGFSELMMNEGVVFEASEIREMAVYINESGKRLHRQIQNYLLYAQLELIASDPKQIKALQSFQVHFANVVISEPIIQQAKKAGRQADLQLDLEETSVAMAATRLTKVVEELLDNAFKFSAAGTPVQIRLKPHKNGVMLSISDRGRGMSTEQIAEVGAYMQFQRKVYEQQGSGLGLAIAKRLVHLHGGELTIKSNPKVPSTTVQIILPTSLE